MGGGGDGYLSGKEPRYDFLVAVVRLGLPRLTPDGDNGNGFFSSISSIGNGGGVAGPGEVDSSESLRKGIARPSLLKVNLWSTIKSVEWRSLTRLSSQVERPPVLCPASYLHLQYLGAP